MINVSSEFRQLMNRRTDFKQNAEITFADGTELTLTEKDFTISNNGVTDGAGSNGIPLGVAVCRSIQIELMNDDERFSDYDFFGAVIRLYLTFRLSATVERIEYGTFTVLTPETYGETVIVTALDDMHKADAPYKTSLQFPATIKAMYTEICTNLGIVPGVTSFQNDDFIVSEAPTDVTFRQVLGYIAMIAGGNARVDLTGRMQIITYDISKLDDIRNSIDGGAFKPWNNPVELDGGDFTYTTGDTVDGGTFTDALSYHILENWKSLKVDTDDVVITGISTTYDDENGESQTLLYGAEGYVLQVSNPLIAGKEATVLELIGQDLVGGRFRQFSGDLISNPTCEFMDIVAILDRKGNTYLSFLTDINFQFFGFTTLKNSAEPVIRNNATTYSEAVKTLVKARELINKERTAREAAVEQLAKDLSNSSGLFMTQEAQEDGSIIYYMHDKPTLAQSTIVWKLTALAFGISTDGGKTYPYGFTVDGTTITRLLYAEGIDADYINTGAIRIADTSGNTLFEANYDTKSVYVNASNVKIGTKAITDELVEMAATISLVDDKVELKASKGELSSLLSVESGAVSIKSNRFSWESTYSSLSSDGKITATGGKIGGFTIGSSAIYSGDLSTLASKGYGVYVGTDGISVGKDSSNYFSVSPADGVKIVGAAGSITLGNASSGRMILDKDGINFGLSDITTTITKDKVVSNLVHCGGLASNYTEIDGSDIYAYYSSTNYTRIVGNEITSYVGTSNSAVLKGNTLALKGSSTQKLELTADAVNFAGSGYIEFGGTKYGAISSNTISVYPTYTYLGAASGYLGFFGTSTKSTKKTVSTISSTSSATAATNATKINELINALKAYNLIG